MTGEPQPRLLYIEEPPSRRQVWVRRLREGALTTGAVAGVACLLVAIAALAFDVRPVVFQSGSMSPAIPTGALAISQTVPASDLAVGDVVTVTSDTGVNVTHRIQNMRLDSAGQAVLVLKGDANGAADEKPYTVTSAPRVLVDVPRLGYVVSWMSGTPGAFLGGLLVGLVLLVAVKGERPRGGQRREPRIVEGPQGRRPGAHRAFVAVSAVAVGLGALALPSTPTTQAYYSDSATLASGTIARQAAVSGTCVRVDSGAADGDYSARLTWTAVSGATSYEAVVNRTSSPTATTTTPNITSPHTTAKLGKNTTGVITVRALGAGGAFPRTVFVADYTGSGNPFANYSCTVR